MKNKKTEQGEKNIVAVEEALSKSEQFIEKNQNLLIGVVAFIVLIIAGYIGFNRFIIEPREQEASQEMFMAERYFDQDSLQLALEGDGAHLGFLDIISEYKMTRSANLARYYAGISYLNMGEYEEAIKHLKKYKRNDELVAPMALGAIGDAYLETGDMEKAADYYEKASNRYENSLTAPAFLMKLAMVYELQGDYQKAVSAYERIQKDFPNTNEGRNIERYLSRAQARINS
ncbi:MAG: tetratricopeptide repeat protein [Bacteroidota bacterium]